MEKCSTISTPNKDRRAQAFARPGEKELFFKPVFTPPLALQRKCAHGEEEEEKLQRKEGGPGEVRAGNPLEHYVRGLNNGGQSFPSETRSFFEPKLGYDFSKVKIHDDAPAHASSRSINALAYTHGEHIVFGEGQYQPHTTPGKKLLAHELTHVVQQGSAGPSSLQQSVQRQDGPPGTATTPPTTATTPPTVPTTVTIDPSCNAADIMDIVNEALVWLDDIYQQLLEYDADEVFASVVAPRPGYARIARALRESFHTTDLRYVEVIRRRFLLLAQLLRASGRISIDCNGQFCTSGGASFTAAFVRSPFALTMCSVGIPGSRPIATFIHELIHATIPQVGISNTVQANGGVRDRAYRDDRAFRYLSPEEALDNADSYGTLAELLRTRSTSTLSNPPVDTTAASCTQPAVVLEAFARADQWNHFALSDLDTDVTLLNGTAALSTLNSGNLAELNAAFPNITTTAQLVALRDAFQTLKRSGFDATTWDFACPPATDRNCNGAVAYSDHGKVSTTAVTLRTISTQNTVTLCPDWFTLSSDDRIRTIYAAFLIGRPSWIVTGFTLSRVFDYVDGARSFANATIPAPTTTSAQQHIDSDQQFRNQQQQQQQQNRPRTP
ncbi:protein of unknown function [Chryseolinea serpens]|uniref:eCIS core domain-containing protein n=1 Tax=Chryseolinea serpens TaxID=947013 RepID=A0A1M5UPG3_9BACT|nr:DUF4157 domain-containing protein [Chryseolinea serpens]SHH64563.1 protein of unknown function [Chryseolinea serpens]